MTEADIDEVPKSIVLRKNVLTKSGKLLEKDLRQLMYPFTAMKLKESVKLKLKDIQHAATNFGAKNILYLTGVEDRMYLKCLRFNKGPTFTFKINSFSLSNDLQNLLPRNKPVNFRDLGVPMVITKGFGSENGSEQNHLTLMNSLFRNFFPGIDHFKNLSASTFKRAVMFYFNKELGVVEVRNYYIRRTFTGVAKNIKKIINNNTIPNFENMNDIADLFVDNDAAFSDSDIDFLPNSKIELQDKILGERKKHQINIRLYVG